MKKNPIRSTNILMCIIITIGFLCTAVMMYTSSLQIFRRDVEKVAALTSASIYQRINIMFAKPITISQTMANDKFLREFLETEPQDGLSDEFAATVQSYLKSYRKTYGYDSVFFISNTTKHYYHFGGIDRIMDPQLPENRWYYQFVTSGNDYSVDIGADKAAQNDMTIFVNCRINDSNGNLLGVVGVGFKMKYLEDIFTESGHTAGASMYLVDEYGNTITSTRDTQNKTNIFVDSRYEGLKSELLSKNAGINASWYKNNYINSRYISMLKWNLITDFDTSVIDSTLKKQITEALLIMLALLLFVLLVLTKIISRCGNMIVKLTLEKEKSHETLFEKATKEMYENIYEIDITRGRAASEETARFFARFGFDADASYDDVLKEIALRQITDEYREGYIATFCSENVIKAHLNGIETLTYDCKMTDNNGLSTYWMRIIGRVFYWEEDESVRMFTYRQNIGIEKLAHRNLIEKIETDSLTGLYNKAATQTHIQELLSQNPKEKYALFILDIDNFKNVNDTCGHSVGDSVIKDFSLIIRQSFPSDAVIGRIGGDEFIAFSPITSQALLKEQAQQLASALENEYSEGADSCRVSSSIGVACSPEHGSSFETLYKNADKALYETKKRGKNGFTIYSA